MKKISTLLLLLLGSAQIFAQAQPKGFHLVRPVNMMVVLSQKPSIASGFSSVSEARTIINDIMNVVGQQQNFKVLSTTQVDNAAAVVYQNQRYILYNPSFINRLDDAASDKWASISVVAHEIGHHLLGHTLDGRGSKLPKELAADEFSGAVMHSMGATLQQSQRAMQLIGSPYASATHPGLQDRLAAISKGWKGTADRGLQNNPEVVINYPSNNGNQNVPGNGRIEYPNSNGSRTTYPGSRRAYPSNNRRNYPDQTNTYPPQRRYPSNMGRTYQPAIVYDVKFRRNTGLQYFITNNNNVIVYNGNRMSTVAKIALTNKPNYPYVIYDDHMQLPVDRRGNIYDENGRNIGVITPHM